MQGDYELVEGVHAIVLHIFTKYFKDYFDNAFLLGKSQVHLPSGARLNSADHIHVPQ
jgi:hypothetical protein